MMSRTVWMHIPLFHKQNERNERNEQNGQNE
jgi:hypothetical protein